MRGVIKKRRITVHMPDPPLPKKGCSRQMPQCNEGHYVSVPASYRIGRYKILDMISDQSIKNTLGIYAILRGH